MTATDDNDRQTDDKLDKAIFRIICDIVGEIDTDEICARLRRDYGIEADVQEMSDSFHRVFWHILLWICKTNRDKKQKRSKRK